MNIFRILLLVLLGYVIFQIIRMVFIVKKAARGGYDKGQSSGKKEKDISRVARIVDEKRLDDEARSRKTGGKRK